MFLTSTLVDGRGGSSLGKRATRAAVPNALTRYDLPDLIHAIAPRPVEVRGPVDPTGKPIAEATPPNFVAGPMILTYENLTSTWVRVEDVALVLDSRGVGVVSERRGVSRPP